MSQNRKKKSLVGWTFKCWDEFFKFDKYSHHGEITVPEIVSNKNWWLKGNQYKVRITITQLPDRRRG